MQKTSQAWGIVGIHGVLRGIPDSGTGGCTLPSETGLAHGAMGEGAPGRSGPFGSWPPAGAMWAKTRTPEPRRGSEPAQGGGGSLGALGSTLRLS